MRNPKFLIVYEIPTEGDPSITYEDCIVCYDEEEKENHIEMLNETYKYETEFSFKVYSIV